MSLTGLVAVKELTADYWRIINHPRIRPCDRIEVIKRLADMLLHSKEINWLSRGERLKLGETFSSIINLRGRPNE